MSTPAYITPHELAQILREEPSTVAVVDVREADYTVGLTTAAPGCAPHSVALRIYYLAIL